MAKKLTLSERVELYKFRRMGAGVREIARTLHRSPSTICEELKRLGSEVNRSTDYILVAHQAQAQAKRIRSLASSRMRLKSSAIRTAVVYLLLTRRRWTPERISGYLRRNHPEHYVCDESIYEWISKERRELECFLPIAGRRKRRSRGRGKRSRLKTPAAPKISIEERPQAINERREFGHWEGDLIEGSARSSRSDVVLSLIERKSCFTIYLRLPNKEAATIHRALKLVFEDLPVDLRRSLTLDNGPENALHATLSAQLGMSVYFCHSYASYEKGQVENSNRDFRKFVPKGMCLSLIDDHLIATAESYRNTLPLKCLGFATPRELFLQQLSSLAH
jgi:IS30 family transposase